MKQLTEQMQQANLSEKEQAVMEKILSNWEGNGYNEIYRLSDSEIEVFKEAVASVTEQYANEYGQEACTAFGINVAS